MKDYLYTDSQIERVAREGGPPALERRWLGRWSREHPGLARAVVSRGRIMGMDGSDLDMIHAWLTGWEEYLERALTLWGRGERPSLDYYDSWGLRQFAEPESYWAE